MGEVQFSQVRVCQHRGGGGVPYLLVPGPFPASGLLPFRGGGCAPIQVLSWYLDPDPFLGRGTPVLTGDVGYPHARTGVSPPPARAALPWNRRAERVLATRQAVCLLRSRRLTFLLHLIAHLSLFVDWRFPHWRATEWPVYTNGHCLHLYMEKGKNFKKLMRCSVAHRPDVTVRYIEETHAALL